MAKFIARPVEVDAYQIERVVSDQHPNYMLVLLDNGQTYLAEEAMLSRIHPHSGDYLVIQADGYEYLNPKDVFERKYIPANQIN